MLRFRQFISERVDTTATASITELFPTLAFNLKFKPSSVEDFKKFLYKLDLKKDKNSFVVDANKSAGVAVIDSLTSLPERLVKTKIENAIGITNYLYDINRTKKIKKVVWGYRQKPSGIPKNHAGDIFIFFSNGDTLGVSLKAGEKKSKEPLLNSYVNTQYKKLNKESEIKKLEDDLWDSVYSKIPGIDSVTDKNNYMSNKNGVRQLYLDFFVENEKGANELYTIMLKVCREHFCDIVNSLSLDEFKDWIKNNFNLQDAKEKVPLILVKAVGKTAEQKNDDLASLLPLINNFKAYLNKSSVQEWLIDIETPEEKKTIKMNIRSDSGVYAGKKLSTLGRLGRFTALKLQYNGLI